MRLLIATSVGPGKEYVRGLLPGVLLGLAQNAPCACDFLVTFDGVEAFPTLDVAGCATQVLSREGTEGLTIDGRLARMRESQRRFFLSRPYTHLYWHDSDMIPPADVLARLLEADVPIASALYNLRGDQEGVMALRIAPEGVDPPEDGPASVPLRCGRHIVASAAGMGAMLVRRDVLEATAFRAPESYVHRQWGEDIRWCLDTGHPVLVDVGLPCWHVAADGTGTRPTIHPAQETTPAAPQTAQAAQETTAPDPAPASASKEHPWPSSTPPPSATRSSTRSKPRSAPRRS